MHEQVAGKKTWFVRPMEEHDEWGGNAPKVVVAEKRGNKNKRQKGARAPQTAPSLCIECEEGDILMINTRLWWHRTELPFEGKERASVSIARDFYCDSTRMGQKERREEREEGDQIFVNRDGIYTSVAVEKDCVILRESEMPDCELPRSEEPNAYIGELDSGEMALLAAHAIPAGEWLSVAPSDDEGEEEEEED